LCGNEIGKGQQRYCCKKCRDISRGLRAKEQRHKESELHKAEKAKIKAENRNVILEIRKQRKELRIQKMILEKEKTSTCKYCGIKCKGDYCSPLHREWDSGLEFKGKIQFREIQNGGV